VQLDQQFVADIMAKRIIDALEAVEVDHQEPGEILRIWLWWE